MGKILQFTQDCKKYQRRLVKRKLGQDRKRLNDKVKWDYSLKGGN